MINESKSETERRKNCELTEKERTEKEVKPKIKRESQR